MPEIAVPFSGGGFSNVVCPTQVFMSRDLVFRYSQFPRPAYQEVAVSRFLKTLPKGTFAGLFNPYVLVISAHDLY